MALTQISTDGIKNGTITGSDLATNVDLVDDQKLRFGTNNDLEIYGIASVGTAAIINHANGDLLIKHGADKQLISRDDGAIELYHDDILRLETTSTGVSVTGVAGIDNSSSTSDVGLRVTNKATAAFSTSENLEGTTNRKLTPLMLRNSSTSANTETYLGFDAGHTSKAQWNIGIKKTASLSGDFIFNTRTGSQTSAERMRITSSGNVGIKCSNPGSLLELIAAAETKMGISLGAVGDNITASRYIGICKSADQTDLGVNSGFQGVEFGGPSSANEGYLAFHTHDFGVESGERLRIDKSGNVGIGTTSPAQKFQVYGNSGITAIALGDNSTVEPYMLLEANETDNLCTVHSRTNNHLTFKINNGEIARFDTSGRFLLGTTSIPSAGVQFDIKRTTDTTTYSASSNHVNGLKIFNDSNTDNGFAGIELAATDSDDFYGSVLLKAIATGTNYSNDFVIQTRHGGTYGERMRIVSSGNVGIGMTSPSAKLDIGGLTNTGGQNVDALKITRTDGLQLFGINWNVSANEVSFSGNTKNYVFKNGSSSAETMRINSDGNLLLGTTSISGTSAQARDIVIGSIGDGTHRGITFATTGQAAIRWADAADNAQGRIQYSNSTDIMTFHTDNAVRMALASDGNVGIGTTSPSAKLQVSGGHINVDSGYSYQWGNSHERIEQSDGKIEFFTNNGEQMTLDGSNLGLGNTSPAAHLHLDGGTGGAQQLRVHNHSSIGTFSGNYGSEFRHATSATTHAMLIHAHEANDARRTLDISDFNGIFTTFVNGKVGIGTTSPDEKLHVANTGGGASILIETNNSSGGNILFGDDASNTRGRVQYLHSDDTMRLFAGGSERVRITADDKVRIGDSLGTNAAGKLQVIEESGADQANDANVYFETNAVDWNLKLYYNTTGTHYHIVFVEQGATRGSVTGNDGSNVTFNQGSDYRWKENVVDLSGSEGIEICKKLKPRKYNWIENREITGQINTVDGFIAHEVEEAGVLGAVLGKKDAVNEDGSIDGQMLDYGQMTPVLAAAIKGLISKVEVLETEVAELKAA